MYFLPLLLTVSSVYCLTSTKTTCGLFQACPKINDTQLVDPKSPCCSCNSIECQKSQLLGRKKIVKIHELIYFCPVTIIPCPKNGYSDTDAVNWGSCYCQEGDLDCIDKQRAIGLIVPIPSFNSENQEKVQTVNTDYSFKRSLDDKNHSFKFPPKKNDSSTKKGNGAVVKKSQTYSAPSNKNNASVVQSNTAILNAFQKKFTDDCVQEHNYYRSLENLPPLELSNNLTISSERWAKELQLNKKFEHSTTPFGENLFLIQNGIGNCKVAVKAWYNEKSLFPKGSLVGDGDFHDYGHYTQVMWNTTTQVGCGIADSEDKSVDIIVCQYNSPGNIVGLAPF